MDCCWTVKKKESEKMDVPPTTLTEKDDMDDQEFMVWLYNHYEERIGYLTVTVRNTAFTLLRKQAKERGWCVSLETGALPVEGCLPEEWVIQRERWNTLAAVWPQLAPTERFLLEGRYFQQRSDRELSDDLGCGANSIRMMMTRARRHVQRLMRREGEDQAAEQQK